jgi:hypothetical protein
MSKDEVVRTDADAVAVAKGGWLANDRAIYAHAVSAPHILDARTAFVDDDAGVLARYERILDAQVAIQAPANDGHAMR